MPERPFHVLFLCTHNSARSVMAEAIVNKLGKGRFVGYSAGSQPSGRINPHALTLLDNLSHDISSFRSKSWSEFAGNDAPKFDFVFTVCDDAAGETCPVWPGQPMTAHWGIADPSRATGSDAEIAYAFDEAYRMLNARISVFMALPFKSLTAMSLRQELKDIGRMAGATSGAKAQP